MSSPGEHEKDASAHDHAHSPSHGIEHETSQDLKAESLLLDRAIGGWRGIIDSGLPTAVFIVVYVITADDLRSSVIAALVVGVALAVWRLIRRQPLTQVGAGLLGLAVSAFFTWRTGRAENFFLPGLLTNLAYGTAFLISILVRWPLLGVGLGYLVGEGVAWRSDARLRRVYAAASWIWVALFFGRVIVQVPLYLAGAVTALGIVKIVMGWPLFLGAAYFTYRLLAPVLEERRALKRAAEAESTSTD